MKLLKILTPFTLPFLLAACGDDDIDTISTQAPDTYEFASLTDSSAASSVDYKEATTRLVLIKELEHLIGSDYLQSYGAAEVTASNIADAKTAVLTLLNTIYSGGTGTDGLSSQNIYDLYDPDNLESDTVTSIKSYTFTGNTPTFDQLSQNINLKAVMPGTAYELHNRNDSDVGQFIGWSITGKSNGDLYPDLLIQEWFNKIATLATDGDSSTKFTYPNINYQALISSFLSASIPYSQVSHRYLSEDALNADNSTENQSQTYTSLEHNFDMAFGYFGTLTTAKNASLDYLIAANDNSKADLDNLLNSSVFATAAAAAQRDLQSPLADINFSNSIVKSFLNGRTVISTPSEELESDEQKALIQTQANTILTNWEQTLAATVSFHLNGVFDNGTADNGNFEDGIINPDYSKHWSHAKGYALALQFNPNSTITSTELTNIHTLISNKPHSKEPTMPAYLSEIVAARDSIQDAYGFSLEDIQGWNP